MEAEPEPDLGPTKEELERGLPPADMLSPHAESEIPEPPEWVDELDASYDEYLTEAEAEAADRLIDAGVVGIVDVTVEPEAEP